MPVNTKKVTGLRTVRYNSLNEFLAEAETFAGLDVRTLGNWSPGQVYAHLAKTMNCSIDGFPSVMPAPVRWMLTLLMKQKFLSKGLPAGFKTTADFIPDATPVEEGLTAVRAAVARQNAESARAMHPGFGNISRSEWNDFHLRHAELHMSFLIADA